MHYMPAAVQVLSLPEQENTYPDAGMKQFHLTCSRGLNKSVFEFYDKRMGEPAQYADLP